MSRKLHDENFVKAQLIAFCKALSKAEAPLKQKHVRALIVGTHKYRSARIFWHAVGRVQLEKNPVLTWKFCHLLHKLIRDGHRKVVEDSYLHCHRLQQLGNFWQHLRTSGYGMANTTYCKMLVNRLQFHKKYPVIVGCLNLAANQLDALTADVNETYELAVDLLDQMDELLGLKATVMNIMDAFRWSSLVPQGQCLLAPLILVILDTSKLYDFLVKALFRLHSRLPPDTLVGHRERFYETFRKTRKFYEEAGSLQYFKYLVSIPTLPSVAPNFLQASDLDTYQTPQAYLHADTNSESGGDVTPPDTQSVCEETIIDLTANDTAMQQLMMCDESQQQSSSTAAQEQRRPDERDELIESLRRDVEAERQCKERLLNEARLRIEQYEPRLLQMKAQIDAQKVALEEKSTEIVRLSELNASQQSNKQRHDELQQQITEKKQKFSKLKCAYDNLRQEHIASLTEVRDLRAKNDAHEADIGAKATELTRIRQSLEALKVDQEATNAANASTIEAIGTQLEEEMRRMDAAIQNGVKQIELLQQKARENLSGVRLEVNDRILEQCTSLMEAVRRLVARSRDVQNEIVTSGRGFGSPNDFYKRNHLWTEGLLSAASAVGVAATVLVNSADGVISGTSKFEHLIVAAQEISASVAQLFVSSRVKADKNSAKMAELAAASKGVNECTASVVAASKTAQQSLADEKLMDFTRLSLHEAKKEEMESQVRTLELEAELDRERAKLAQLRKQHYHLASLVSVNNNGENTDSKIQTQ